MKTIAYNLIPLQLINNRNIKYSILDRELRILRYNLINCYKVDSKLSETGYCTFQFNDFKNLFIDY